MRPEDPSKLRALLDLNREVDELVENALRERRSLAEAMARVLPVLCERVGARAAFVRSFDEDLALRTFSWPAGFALPAEAAVFARTGPDAREEVVLTHAGAVVIAQPLDVAGEWFGSAALVLDEGSAAAGDPAHVGEALSVACEELDNFLHSIRAARERHRIMMELGAALGHRVLGEGIKAAVRILTDAVAVDRLLLVCLAEEEATSAVQVQMFERGQLVVDTMGALASHPDERAIVEEARAYLAQGGKALLERFDLVGAREEVLINGVTEATLVGKVLVTPRNAAFNTYDRDLLAGFAGFVRQRVVDFNKEWRTLAHSFRAEDVSRLLSSTDYVRRYLAPREESVAMLYVDIAGFTRLSEQVLRSPSAVAELVEAWSRDAVHLVWEHGGVFDKMVGDCIIALFGPPFYESTPGERLASALRCAVAIREMTTRLPERPQFAHLREVGVSVSTGVNLAPLFVGRFGPNDNFTGFSSGMNNTARLQGCATKDEILVMADPIATLPEGQAFAFGEERSAKVKNVADPIRFRALL